MCPFPYLSLYVSLLFLHIYIYTRIYMFKSTYACILFKTLGRVPLFQTGFVKSRGHKRTVQFEQWCPYRYIRVKYKEVPSFLYFSLIPPSIKTEQKLQNIFMMKKNNTHKYLQPLPSKLAASLRTSSFFVLLSDHV